MFNLFSKPEPKDQQRENAKALRKVERDLEREKQELAREEKKLEIEIQKLAKEGNKQGCIILVKQLVQVRKQKERIYSAGSKVQNIGYQNKNIAANIKLGEAMSVSANTMGEINKIMKPEKIAADVQEFSRAAMKMDMTDEMINDTLDDMLTESGDEEETDQIVTQVLDEIGIEVSGKMRNAPSALNDGIGNKSKSADDIIEAELAKLKS